MTKKIKTYFYDFFKALWQIRHWRFFGFVFFFFFNKCVFINVQNTGIAAQMKGEFTIN